MFASPFLADGHLVLLTQFDHTSPGLCQPNTFGVIHVSRYDTNSFWQCRLPILGESEVIAAALLRDAIVIGRRIFVNDPCTYDLQPAIIDAYGLPGESLAPAGWVQRGGNPGLGLRPVRSDSP